MMGRRTLARLALAASICAGAFATGCKPPPTEGWRSELVTVNEAGTAGPNRLSGSGDINADGTKVLFTTAATDMGFPDTTSDGVAASVYLHDLTTGQTARLNGTPDGTDGGNGSVSLARFAEGGRSVVFATTDSNLGPLDANGASDLYLHDLATGDTRLLTTDPTDTSSANGSSSSPIVSEDGRVVVFTSSASDLGPSDANGAPDTYALDLSTNAIHLVSVNLSGEAAGSTGGIGVAALPSSDGTKVPFLSAASGIVPTPTTGTNAYIRDLAAGTSSLVSVGSEGAALPPGTALGAVVDPTGERAAVRWRVTGTPTTDQIYVHELSSATTALVSRNGPIPGNGISTGPVFSPDGSRLAFMSTSSNLVAGDNNGFNDVFVHAVGQENVDLVSHDVNGVPANRPSSAPRFSPDGSKLAFVTGGANIVQGFPAISSELYLRDLESGSAELVSLDQTGAAGANFTLGSPAQFASDGRSILFASSSPTLDGRPVLPAVASLFVAKLTPYAVADLGITARMAETPPVGAAWAVELLVTNDGSEDAGIVRVGYFFPYLGGGHTVTTDRGTCTVTHSGPGDTTVACVMSDLPVGATATIVITGQFPLGSLAADTVGAVSGVRVADPDPADNTVTFHVSES
jgi:Tol biopolymer transport system component